MPYSLKYTPTLVVFFSRNKGFAAHIFLHPKEGEVIDIKESFSI